MPTELLKKIQNELNYRRKNHFRSSMGQDCLSSLVLLSYKHDLAKELIMKCIILHRQEQEELTSEALGNLL